MSLSTEQQRVLDLVKRGKSVFFTGAAGTGKSFLLHHIIRVMEPRKRVFVTASTGIAALAITGTTLHSFAGIGLAQASLSTLVRRIRTNGQDQAWRECELLIIDEISMIDAKLFTLLEKLARCIRDEADKPFGGIQLVISGDFLQLPPVWCNDGDDGNDTKTPAAEKRKFCFQTPLWSKCVPHQAVLTKIFRQRNTDFQRLLNNVRFGHITPQDERTLLNQLRVANKKETTRLYSRRRNVDKDNNERLQQLDRSSAQTYWAVDTGRTTEIAKLKRACVAPDRLELRINAQVLLIYNLNSSLGLQNGSRGRVVAYSDDDEDRGKRYPVVLFARNDNMNRHQDVRMTMRPQVWRFERRGQVLASRRQVPLILAWALTIHKAMGMTLETVAVALDGCFACGQAYVGLSRVVALEGLTLLSYKRSAIRANSSCAAYYNKLLQLRKRKRTDDDDDDDDDEEDKGKHRRLTSS